MSGQPEESQKTEAATPKTLKKAREKGQVASSKLVPIGLAVSMMIVWLLYSWSHSRAMLASVFSAYSEPMIDNYWKLLGPIFDSLKESVLVILVPLLLLMFLGAVAGNLIVKGVVLSTHPLKPDIKRLNPVSGVKKLFKIDHLYLFSSSIIIAIIIIIAGTIIIFHMVPTLLSSLTCGLDCLNRVVRYAFTMLVYVILGLSIIVCTLDWGIQQRLYLRRNKMTKDQVKREHKQDQGDGQIKSKRREIARELLEEDRQSSGALPASAPGSYNGKHLAPTLLITDNIQRAVGIHYLEAEDRLPCITHIKYLDSALKLIEQAQAAKIVIHYDPGAVKTLSVMYKEGEQITPETFSLVIPAIVEMMQAKDQ